ncbi:hypothetical protein CWB66_09720 [Pseudoalteromonas sp. S558]|nr:hypothetical protein CWB66_09720 [Pseudoalteromonas sp. S558]
MKTRRIYASIAGLLQVNSTQLALKIAARDRFIIQSSGYLSTRSKLTCFKVINRNGLFSQFISMMHCICVSLFE